MNLKACAMLLGLAAALTAFMAAPPAHAAAVEPGTLLFEFDVGSYLRYLGLNVQIREVAVGPNGSIAVCSAAPHHPGRISLVEVFHPNGTLYYRGSMPCGGVLEFAPNGVLFTGTNATYLGYESGGVSFRAMNLTSDPGGKRDYWHYGYGYEGFKVGPDGSVAVSDHRCNCVKVYHPDGSTAFALWGQSVYSRAGDKVYHPNGSFALGEFGRFDRPYVSAIDPNGNILVSAFNSSLVREHQVFLPNGTFLGILNASFWDDYDRYANERGPGGERVYSYGGGVVHIRHYNGTVFELNAGSPVFGAAVGPTGLVVVSLKDQVRVYSGIGVAGGWDPPLLYAQVLPPSRDLPAHLPPGTLDPQPLPPTRAEYVSQLGSYGSSNDMAPLPDKPYPAPVFKLGSYWAGAAELNAPGGVAVGPDGLIAVSDMAGNRVHVFRPDGTLAFKFGSYGQGAGEFDGPSGIAFGPDGLLVVHDVGNQRVQVFRLR